VSNPCFIGLKIVVVVVGASVVVVVVVDSVVVVVDSVVVVVDSVVVVGSGQFGQFGSVILHNPKSKGFAN
jgi:hypothetical protein